MNTTRTTRASRPRDLHEATKELLRTSLSLAKIKGEKLAEYLGESDALVDAWRGETKKTHVPLWILASPGLLAQLRTMLLAGLDALAQGGTASPSAHTPAAQTDVALATIGAFISTACASLAGDRAYDAEESRRTIVAAAKLIEQPQALVRLLQREQLGAGEARGHA